MKKRILEFLILIALALSVAWMSLAIYLVVKGDEAYSSTIEYRGHSYIYFHADGASATTHDPDCPCHKKGVKEP